MSRVVLVSDEARTLRRIGRMALAVALGPIVVACGGGNGGSAPPPPPVPVAAQNPCPTSSLAPTANLEAAPPPSSKTRDDPGETDPMGTLAAVLWRHRAAEGRLAMLPGPLRANQDVGDIAVIQDEGDLVAPANPFDLHRTGVRYVPKAGGGYDVTMADSSFRAALGDPVTLADDDSVAKSLAFGFTFYGTAQSVAFVNSDGNITFGEGDRASTARSIGRLLTGAPRVAPFLADLDPSVGGTVFVRAGSDAFTATWCGVRVFESSRQATLQTSLLPDGTIEMKYAGAPPWDAVDGVVAISPGRTDAFLPVDLSTTATASISGIAGALGERFAQRPDLDLVALARKFYASHADAYDQLVVWTDQVLTPRDVEVPPFFYVESPTNVQGNAQADSPPSVGVTFSGTRRDVLMNDVIEVMGPRQPPADDSARVLRQAFLFVVGRGRSAGPTSVAKIDRIRRAWEAFYAQATDGRAHADTRLQPPT